MIVISVGKKLKIVTQIDHAHLSHQISLDFFQANLYGPLSKAIKHHDDGWKEWDRAPRFEDGKPRDYRNMNLGDHLEILTRSIKRCESKHAYAGWLTSKHSCSFHRSKSGTRVEEFLNREHKRQQSILQNNSLPDSQRRTRNFNCLQFFDALSLFLISPWAENWKWNRENPARFQAELESRHCFNYRSSMETGNFTYTISANVVKNKKYSSKSEFRTALQSSETDKWKIKLVSKPDS